MQSPFPFTRHSGCCWIPCWGITMPQDSRCTSASVIYHTLHLGHRMDTPSADLQRNSQQVLRVLGPGGVLSPLRLEFASNVGKSTEPCFHTSPGKSNTRNQGWVEPASESSWGLQVSTCFLPNPPLPSFFNFLNQPSFKEN